MTNPSLNVKKTALVVGLSAAILYAFWAILIGIGGTGYFKIWQKIHLVAVSTVPEFSVGYALLGLIWHFVAGALAGALFAWLWNKIKE